MNMTPHEIAENIIQTSKYIAENFPGGWNNIRTLHIKGLRSIALPIYMSLSKYRVLKVVDFVTTTLMLISYSKGFGSHPFH